MLITLLVGLVIACLVYWAVMRVLAAFGIVDPIATLVKVVFVIVVVLWLLSTFGFAPAGLLR